MSKTNITQVVSTVYGVLEPLSTEDRRRALRATMALFEEALPEGSAAGTNDRGGGGSGLSPRAAAWIKQNGLSQEQIDSVFHLGALGFEVIAEIPGNGKSEQTQNAYLLLGVASFLTTGEASVDDKTARALCNKSGCYSQGNHAKYVGGLGSYITGTKDTSWSLTIPGLKRGAEIIKAMRI